MLEEIRASQKPSTEIVMVPGNGEYIDQELTESRQEYRAAVERVPNAVFLDDEAVTTGTGVTVIGSNCGRGWTKTRSRPTRRCSRATGCSA